MGVPGRGRGRADRAFHPFDGACSTAPFTFVVGLALLFTGIHLCFASWKGFRKMVPTDGCGGQVCSRARITSRGRVVAVRHPSGIGVETVSKGGGRLTVGFWGQTWTVNIFFLFVTGALVGTISAALGVGGGFILVPIFVTIYGLPIYVLVAATIPYVIVLSAVGLFTYGIIMPGFTGSTIQPEWSWGLFAAAGGIFGAWAAAKTQRFVPEHLLKLMLGAITGIVGTLYAVNFFYTLPFRL